MARPKTKDISKETSIDEVERNIAETRDCIGDKKLLKVLDRLEFVRLLLMGYGLQECCDIVGISKPTGYEWQKLWNEGGMDDIVPNFSGGVKGRLTDGQLEKLKAEVDKAKMTTAEARVYIAEEFEVEYSEKQVHVILSDKLGLRHAKPYEIDYRSPPDAEQVVKKTSAKRWTVRSGTA